MIRSNFKINHELEKHQQFEELLLEISAKFISLPVEFIDDAVEEAQRRICETMKLDLSALWQWSYKDPRIMTLTHLYSPPEGPERPVDIDASKTFPWFMQKALSGEILAVSTEELPEEASLDKQSRRFYGVKSSVVIPVHAGGKPVIGIVSWDTLHEERSWSEEDVQRLKLVTEIFSNALARRQSEQKIINSEARLSLAAESAGAGIWELDCRTNIFWATKRALKIFGYNSEDIITMDHFEQTVHPDDIARVKHVISRSFESREPINVEYRILIDDHVMKWIYSSGRPYYRTNGKPDRLLGVSIDITERKKMEEELLQRETSLRYSQRDLQKLAGRLISVKEQELRRLSRELHDDLTQRLAVLAIEAGKLEMHLEKNGMPFPEFAITSKIKEDLIKISKDVHRISRQLHPTILDDLGLIKAIESECEALGQREDIEIIFSSENVADRAPGDVSLCIYRIVQESLHNVINHSGTKKCKVLLRGRGETISLVVEDDGVGFDPAEVRKKPGLGLASMKERVQLVQGNFSVDAKPGRGTAINVTIPIGSGER